MFFSLLIFLCSPSLEFISNLFFRWFLWSFKLYSIQSFLMKKTVSGVVVSLLPWHTNPTNSGWKLWTLMEFSRHLTGDTAHSHDLKTEAWYQMHVGDDMGLVLSLCNLKYLSGLAWAVPLFLFIRFSHRHFARQSSEAHGQFGQHWGFPSPLPSRGSIRTMGKENSSQTRSNLIYYEEKGNLFLGIQHHYPLSPEISTLLMYLQGTTF